MSLTPHASNVSDINCNQTIILNKIIKIVTISSHIYIKCNNALFVKHTTDDEFNKIIQDMRNLTLDYNELNKMYQLYKSNQECHKSMFTLELLSMNENLNVQITELNDTIKKLNNTVTKYFNFYISFEK